MSSIKAYIWNKGSLAEMKKHKGKVQAGEQSVRPNTDDLQDGILLRSSDEAPLMGVERRG
jgi:hypothetical protein